jgi:hypothetical protein
MELPKLKKPESYVGLYIFDFGEHTGVGFTAQEVAELLESEKYNNGKVYKIHKAYPDGRLEIKGVPAETFELEAGMFFYSGDKETARSDFERLADLAVRNVPPCRVKVHLARCAEESFVVGLIYPAEYDDEISSWLSAGDYRTSGAVEGGVNAVQRYYDRQAEVLDKHQWFGRSELESRTGEELLASVKLAIQR